MALGETLRLDSAPARTWDDGRLVKACLDGDERAWAALIDKYKNLIYSIPLKYRASPEDAADIFQAVCIELYNELPKLRSTGSLKSWLAAIASHQAFHWKRRHVRRESREGAELEQHAADAVGPLAPDPIEEAEREQIVREAIAHLSPRCRTMIHLLFYAQPPLPYAQVASRLGLAVGSIGFIRGRCLKKLQDLLRDAGF